MKLLCETQVVNRQIPNTKIKTTRATLAIGFHPPGKKNAELFIIHFTLQNRNGFRYRIRGNLEKVFTKFMNDGKATIAFKIPEHNLQIKCDPIQLKCFLQTLKLGLEGKSDMNNIGLNNLATAPIPHKSHPITKYVVTRRADYPLKGFPKTVKLLYINGIKISRIDTQILFLHNLTKLNLSENSISTIPKGIGLLNLVDIDFSCNQLGSAGLNDWEWLEGKSLQRTLKDLNLSNNMLTYFPYKLIKMQSLVTLKLDKNEIKTVPFAIRSLVNLRYFHISSNKLESLPHTVSHLRLNTLDVWENNFLPIRTILEETLKPKYEKICSLLEIAARVIVYKKIPYSSCEVPSILIDVLSETPLCFCGQLSLNGKILERSIILNFENVKHLVFSRDRAIYADCISCSKKCEKQFIMNRSSLGAGFRIP